MNNRSNKLNFDKRKPGKKDKNAIPDSLLYPPSEDIYNRFEKEMEIDPEDLSKKVSG
ncbi:hypothetical protein [Flavobacterium sp. GNP002]